MPRGLAWVERGSALIRRMNSERIAEDPRLKRLLFPEISDAETDVGSSGNQAGASNEMDANDESQVDEEEMKAEIPALKRETNDDTGRDSFEALDATEAKQEEPNEASHSYRLMLWTYRLHASIQNSFQHALFAKASEDGYFIPVAPRLFCVAPAYLNVFIRLFDAHTGARQWNAALKLLEQLDSLIAKRFDGGACVFDCGLFDGIKRLHGKSLLYDEFGDGRIASIAYNRGSTPSMHSAFIVASTVSAWLAWKPMNAAVLLAPTNDQLSVFATTCALYETKNVVVPSKFADELLEVYQQHIRGSESWPAKLQRTFSGLDSKNTYYCEAIPRPLTRFVTDFQSLLSMRDEHLLDESSSPGIQARKQKLNGIAVTPAPEQIYFHQILLLHCGETALLGDATSVKESSFRPYFVLQNDKGVLFSSMVNGVRNCSLFNGPHVFQVGKTIDKCGEFTLRMYDLPFGRQGQLIFNCRLHATLMLEMRDGTPRSMGDSDVAQVTLKLEHGDFDCVSSTHTLPKDFAVQLVFARTSEAFPPSLSSLRIAEAHGEERRASSASSPPDSSSSFDQEDRARNGSHVPKNAYYAGPPVVTFIVNHPDVRTSHGDGTLEKVEVVRRATRGRLDIYVLFFVKMTGGQTKVLPYRHLFHYLLPDEVRMKLVEMGASEESMRNTLPNALDSSLDITFDEEYARWLQQLYDTDLNSSDSNYDGEFLQSAPIADAQIGTEYRCVSITTNIISPLSRPRITPPMRGPMRLRGASSLLIHQLPTYTFTTQRDHIDQSTPDCLVCRCSFEVGDEVKSLPCFHSYHSDCIDSWLQLNKVCPVCQHSIDQQFTAVQ